MVKGRSPGQSGVSLPSAVREALDRGGVRYCVLSRPATRKVRAPAVKPTSLDGMGPARILTPSPVDVTTVLVHPEDLAALESYLEEDGFLLFPGADVMCRSHLLGRSSKARGCLRVDVRTELRYGLARLAPAEPESHLLRRTRRKEGVPVLALEDEVVDLLLHGILDTGGAFSSTAPALRACVEELRRRPVHAGRAAERIQRELAPALTWDALLHDVGEERWSALTQCRSALKRRLIKGEMSRGLARGVGAALRVMFAPVGSSGAVPSWRRGAIVALMGPDGSGKSSVASDLACWLPASPRVMQGGYPRPRLPIPRAIHRPISFWGRAATLRWHRTVGHLVIVDRYVFDSWIDDGGLDPARRSWRRRIMEWPFPTPDFAVVLDAPGGELYRRSREHSPEVLERRRRGYLGLRKWIPGLAVVDASRPQAEVVASVAALVCPGTKREMTRRRHRPRGLAAPSGG